MTPSPHPLIIKPSHTPNASLTHHRPHHEEMEEKHFIEKSSKTAYRTLFDFAEQHTSRHVLARLLDARCAAPNHACAAVDDLSALWETPAKEKDRAAARAALVILSSPSIELNRSEDLHG
jgi:hypothetical protein